MHHLLPRLPAELTDMVIDHLCSDEDTLCTTSLVSRSWLPRSRLHLFQHVKITAGFDELLLFLSRTPQVRGYIRHLVLQGAESCVGEDDDSHSTKPTPCTTLPSYLLADIVAQLPRLSTVQLHNVSFHNNKAYRLPAYPLLQLDELTLMNVGSVRDTTDDILSVLGLFSEIKYLHMNSIAQVANMPSAEGTRRITPGNIKVHALKFEDVPSDIYFEVIQGTRSRDALRCIEAECTGVEDSEALASLLEDAGSSLEHLAVDLTQCFHLEYYPEESEEAFIPDPRTISELLGKGFSACPRLRSVDIAVCFDFPTQEGAPYTHSAWDCLVGVLSRVPTSVQDLTIQLSVELWDATLEELHLDWEPMRAVLKRLEKLRSITFSNVPASDWHFSPEEKESVVKHLAVWQQKGVLHVGY